MIVSGGKRRCIYLAHPLGVGPDREANREAARAWAAWAASRGHDVEASWIDRAELVETPESRAEGMATNMRLLALCQELWAVGGGWSPGMREERAHAEKLGLRVVDLTGLGRLPPEAK